MIRRSLICQSVKTHQKYVLHSRELQRKELVTSVVMCDIDGCKQIILTRNIVVVKHQWHTSVGAVNNVYLRRFASNCCLILTISLIEM